MTDTSSSTIIFATGFSSDGEYLISGNNFGTVMKWSIDPDVLFQPHADGTQFDKGHFRDRTQGLAFQAHSNPIYSIACSDRLLVTGADEEIRGWSMPMDNEPVKTPAFELVVPQKKGFRGALSPVAETNGIQLSETGDRVYAAAGDNNGYCWDLETQQLVHCFKGHHDYLHCINVLHKSGLVATGSEDGTLKLWDTRTANCVSTSQISQASGVTSGDGRVTCATVDEDENWIAFGGHCNGQAYANLCHVSSRVTSAQTSCPKPMTQLQAIDFVDDNIIMVGDTSHIYYATKDLSTTVVRVPTSSNSVFALSHQKLKNGRELMAVAGSSPVVDLFAELRNRVFSFNTAP